MRLITIISSIKVKPWVRLLAESCHLPVLVLRAVQTRTRRFGEYIENTLSTPGIGIGIVLHGSLAPFVIAGHRIHWNLA